MNNKILNRIFILISAVSLVLATGCTHMINPPKKPFTTYPAREKIHLKVGLNITDELRKAKCETHAMGDTWVIPIGNSIATNAGVLARHAFDEVIEANNGQFPAGQSLNSILTPKVAHISRTMGATSFGDSVVDIRVEWTLSDPSGNTIWVDTIAGKSTGSTGWTSPEKILKNALEDLLLKSEQAISSAPLIRQFAEKKSP